MVSKEDKPVSGIVVQETHWRQITPVVNRWVDFRFWYGKTSIFELYSEYCEAFVKRREFNVEQVIEDEL